MSYETVDRAELLQFERAFKALTTHDHFPWQYELYQRLVRGDVPEVCDIPTGLGKTCVIPIWVIALANALRNRGEGARLPRRLIYIVNRRTVVDQGTDEAERLRDRITGLTEVSPEEREILDQLKERLVRASSTMENGVPIAISTLRGELADNGDWKADPAGPAIIIGTVDMIGSRLLFSGYGDGFKLRPHHAGLIGQDALFVHDEAHLTPAFSELLKRIAGVQREDGEPRAIGVVELSATPRPAKNLLSLGKKDEEDGRVLKRLDAQKTLFLYDCKAGELVEALVGRAVVHEKDKARVLIYVRLPEKAREVAEQLKNRLGEDGTERLAVLTGTLRGYERDNLLKSSPVFQAMLPPPAAIEKTVYLVSTSAGEVGINLDADHMVCDLATLDSLIQRLGRVNRFGEGAAQIDVVVEGSQNEQKREGELERALAATKVALQELPKRMGGGYSASPRALRQLADHAEAWAPQPEAPPLDEILLDAWSLTSIREELPNRPAVASWLHGLTDDLPETYVAWRAEVGLLSDGPLSRDELRDWFHNCRIEGHEQLREPTNRIQKKLAQLLERHEEHDLPMVLLDERGNGELTTLATLLGRGEDALRYGTVVLPAEAGGLSPQGILDPRAARPTDEMDVAEKGRSRTRLVLRQVGEECWYKGLLEQEVGPLNYARIEDFVALLAKQQGMVVGQLLPLSIAPEGEEDSAEVRYLLLLVEPKRAVTEVDEWGTSRQPQGLAVHTGQTVEWTRRVGEALDLDRELNEALMLAAGWHDRGKDRKRWQRGIHNFEYPEKVNAKAGARGMDWRLLGGYRHEFGSVLEAIQCAEVQNHPQHDLILHLIAAHHGRARPHFDGNAYDIEQQTTEANEEAAREVMRRFGRVQQRFGRWGLAWLESLLRCADALASREGMGEQK